MDIEVVDDGVGGASIDRGTGIRGLLDRADVLGGDLQLTSQAGVGTRLTVRLPLSRDTASLPHPVSPDDPASLQHPASLEHPVLPDPAGPLPRSVPPPLLPPPLPPPTAETVPGRQGSVTGRR